MSAFMKNGRDANLPPKSPQRIWTGRKLTSEIAAKDLANHAVFNLEEQLALFDEAQGKSKLQNWLTDIAAFYESIGMVRKEDRQRLRRMNAVTDDYLKALR